MAAIIFDPTAFREEFPAFNCTPPISNDTLQAYFDQATLYINNPTGGAYCNPERTAAQRRLALYLMTAHLAAIARLIYQGQAPGIMTSATVDKVSVTLEPPPAANQWQYWLQSTPYGQQLLALLQVVSVGGTYINPRPELAAFRRVGWC